MSLYEVLTSTTTCPVCKIILYNKVVKSSYNPSTVYDGCPNITDCPIQFARWYNDPDCFKREIKMITNRYIVWAYSDKLLILRLGASPSYYIKFPAEALSLPDIQSPATLNAKIDLLFTFL